MTGEALLAHLAAFPPDARDAEVERLLGIADADFTPPAPDCLGYHPSGVAPVVRALIEAPVTEDDLFVDLGSGLGKAAMLARLISGARARGIELQAALVARARQVAVEGVEFIHADVREAPLDEGTVFFLYNPFTGAVLHEVLARLRAVAQRHAIVVCALGINLERGTGSWLKPREVDAFWLQVFDSVVPGVPPRVVTTSRFDARARLIAHDLHLESP